MRNFFKLLVAAVTLSFAVPAVAQVPVQPVYTRPAKGPMMTAFDAVSITDATTSRTTSVYDWSAYSGAMITVVTTNTSNGVNIAPNVCSFSPKVAVSELPSRTVATTLGIATNTFPANAGNASVRAYNISDKAVSYYVSIGTPYVRFVLTSEAAPTNGFTTGITPCTVSVYITPMPFPPSQQSVLTAIKTSVSLADTVSGLTFPSRVHKIFLQNQGTTPVYCSLNSDITNAPANYEVVLSAATVAADGSGGSWLLEDYGGTVFCVRANGAAAALLTGYYY